MKAALLELHKLRQFYRDVAALTRDHSSIQLHDDDIAVVYPSDLSVALEKVNPDWLSERKEQQ